MCWVSRQVFPIVKIADKPIKVYKYLCAGLESPCTNYKYELNKLNKFVPLLLQEYYIMESVHNYYINAGYHSYSTFKVAENNGYIFRLFPSSVIYECEIPAGSHYYINEDNEIVSDNIIIRKSCVGTQAIVQ